MIELYEGELRENGRRSSKGNQLKFERDGVWYKADYLGYEGLAEYTVSKLLRYSTLKENEYVDYSLEQISYNGNTYNACKSCDFSDGWTLITLERLFKSTYGTGLNHILYGMEDHADRLRVLTEQVERLTGLRDFGQYMCKLLTVDSLFLNEDRHTHNIAVLTNERKEFRLVPIFDNGAALLADTALDYPLNQDTIELMKRARPKTFCDDFAEQITIAEQLYGRQIRFRFTRKEVVEILDETQIYEKSVRDRVTEIVMQMRRKYSYLF